MQNANDIRFRCSSLGHLMIEPRSKSETLSESTKTHLIDVFVSAKYDRREQLQNKFLDKGNEREEDAITLLSRVNKIFLKKNDIRLENDFISGECDIFLGENINCASETFDTKCCWSAHTFFRAQKDAINKMYMWQGIGYMWLTGAQKHTIVYCLVNGTQKAIMDEKRKLEWMNISEKKKLQLAKQIEINHIFDVEHFKQENPFYEFENKDWMWDIPMEDRIFSIPIPRIENEIKFIEKRVIDCKNWMNANLFKV